MWELQVAAGAAKQLPNKASAAGYFPCFCCGSQIFLFFGMKGFWMIHWKSSFDDVRSKHIFLEIDKLPNSFNDSMVHVGGQNMNQIHPDLSLCTATLVRSSIPQPRKTLCLCVFVEKSGLCKDVTKKKLLQCGDTQSECLVLLYVCWVFFHSHLGCVLCCGGRGYNKYMKDGVEPAAFASSGTTAGTSQFKDFPSPSRECSTHLKSLKVLTRWWQLKYFLFSHLFGEDFQFD